MRIAHADLQLSPEVGKGAQGTIYRVRNRLAVGLDVPLIYKEFGEKITVSGASLEILTSFRAGLDEGERRVVDERTVWPIAVVERGGRICGYVMQAIPDTYMQTILTTEGSEPIPREVQHLFVADGLARRNIGEVPTPTERLALAREAAFVFGFLHKREFIFGDFSYKNAVYTLRPKPMVMLLDCDAIRHRGQGGAVAQLNSPGWGAPEKGPQTIESDRYKLGLFVLRTVTPGVNAQNRDPAKAAHALDARGQALLRRALSDVPSQRPSGKEWVAYLDDAIAAAGGVHTRSGRAALPAPPPAAGPVRRVAGARVRGPQRPPATSPRTPTASPRGARVPTRSPRAGAGRPHPKRVHPAQVRTVRGRALLPAGAGVGGRMTGLQAVLLVGWLAVLTFFLVAVAANPSSSSAKKTTTTTSVTRSTLSGPTPTTALGLSGKLPVGSADTITAASQAVDAAALSAGAGWHPAGFAEQLTPGTVVWKVLLVSDPIISADGSRAQDVRTVSVGWAGTTDDGTVRVPLATDEVALPQFVGYWPLVLGRAFDTVATPNRSRLNVLVRYGWDQASDDPAVTAGWELRYVNGASGTNEADRVYLTPDGSATMPAPSWATPPA